MESPRKQYIDLFAETLHLAYAEAGTSTDHTFLVLHGGAGPNSVAGLVNALGASGRTIAPTHPGFDGEARPERFTRMDDLALAYLAAVEKLGLERVIVVGNSVGGWLAAEIALRQSSRVAGIVLLNAVGIQAPPDAPPIGNPMTVPAAERAAMSFYDPARWAFAPAGPEAAAAMANNQRTLSVYAGEPFMYEPTLADRLQQVAVPALLLWGESDRIVDTAYGRRYASLIPGARFEIVPQAGHFPQIEQLDVVVRQIEDFVTSL